jgi:hypothetical protein
MFPLRAARTRAFQVHAAVTARRTGRRTARECCSPFGCRFQWWDVTAAPAVISFIGAHPEITMSMPNEDYQDIDNVCTAMCCVRSSWLKLKPERLPDVVRVENSCAERESKVIRRTTCDRMRSVLRSNDTVANGFDQPIKQSINRNERRSQSRTTRDTTAASLVQFIYITALFHGCWHPRNRHERLRYLIEQLARILFFAQ